MYIVLKNTIQEHILYELKKKKYFKINSKAFSCFFVKKLKTNV